MIGNYLNQRYRLDAEIGRGGLGIIYRGYDTLLDRQVAVKVLNAGGGLGSQGQARLLNEARAAARLNHPNIVSVFDAGKTDPTLHSGDTLSFIVMELVEGDSLHDRKPKTIEETLSVARQICVALQVAHDNGIIHRDLKPENVLITPEGVAKLTDFGLARSHASRLSSENMLIGTVYYMAPEMALGQAVDARTDLYALGIMLYELLTGVLPFTADDPLAVISQHIHAPAVPPSTHNPMVSPALDSLVLRLLAKKPEDRIPSASETARVIEDILGGAKNAELPEMSPLERLARGRLIGRDKQIVEVRSLWKKVQSGSQSHPLLLIGGESGVGKTPFLREITSIFELSGAWVFRGQCYAEGNAPYAPIGQMLREALPLGEKLLAESVVASLRSLVPELSLQPAGTLPPAIDPLSEQQRYFESILLLLQALAVEKPVVFQLEDVHWADGGSLSMIRYLARRIRAMRPVPRIWVIMTYRDSDIETHCCLQDFLVDFNMEHLASYIHLDRLTRAQTKDLLETMFHEEVNARFVDLIYKVTEGNYFFIEEMCKSLIEEGVIYRENGHWRLDFSSNEIHLPQSVHLTIQARVSKLNESVQEVLRLAAVIGREFDFQILKHASGLDEEVLINALEQAENAQLIQEASLRGDRRAGIEMFSFVHGLIPMSLREEISALRRRRMHRRILSAFEALHPEDLEALAYHAEEAGDLELARQYTFRVAERALGVFSNREAERYFRSALKMNLEAEKKVKAVTGLAEALFRQGKYSEAAELWEDAAQKSLDTNDHDASARYAAKAARARWHEGDMKQSVVICETQLNRIRQTVTELSSLNTPGMASLMHELARAYRFNNQPEDALPLCRQALDLAENLKLVDVQADALATLGILPNISREEARKATQRAIELAEEHGLYSIAYRAHNNFSQMLYDAGDLSGARAHRVRCRELAQKMGNVDWEIHQLGGMVLLSLMMGDMPAVRSGLETMRTLAPQVPQPQYSLMDLNNVEARVAAVSGDFETARRLYDGLLEFAQEKKEPEYYLHVLLQLTDLALETGDVEEANRLLEIARTIEITEPFMDKIATIVLLADVHLRRGDLDTVGQLLQKAHEKVGEEPTLNERFEIMWVEARWRAAGQDYDAAFRLFKELDEMTASAGLVWLRGRVLLDWADALTRRLQGGDLQEAANLLRMAHEIFEKIQAEGYLRKVQTRTESLASLRTTD